MLTFEQVEECFPDGESTDEFGQVIVSVQWLHDFARAIERAATPQWQPIETAPKDGTPIDIWRGGIGGERCTNMFRVDLGNGNVFYDPVRSGPACVRDATHWMPMPPAPEAAKEMK